MSKKEKWIVSGVLAGLAVWLLILTVLVAGELGAINRHLMLLSGEGLALETSGNASLEEEDNSLSLGSVSRMDDAPVQVGVANVAVLTDTIIVPVTVRAYGVGDLLFEPPVLVSEEGTVYQITGDSLELARLAFLNLVTRGEASAEFVFSGRLTPTDGLWLVFNPNQEEGNVVAPSLQVPVPIQAGLVDESSGGGE